MEIDKANFINASSERIDTYYEIKNKKEDVRFKLREKFKFVFQYEESNYCRLLGRVTSDLS